MHALIFLPFAVFCTTAVTGAVVAGLIELRAPRPALPSAKIYYFRAAKTSLRSNAGAARPALRLISNGG